MATTIDNVMRAWTHTTRGVYSKVLHLSHDIPVPYPPTGSDILIHVTHAAVSPGDLFILSLIPLFPFTKRPCIPGIECAGVVAALGPSVPVALQLPLGTAVFGIMPPSRLVWYGQGTQAEYVVLPAESVIRIPSGITPSEAAGLSGNGQTALKLVKEACVKKGDRVLVYGASGGVGGLTVQIAKGVVGEEGYVVGVCSAANAELVKSLGADEVIDYKAHTSLESHLSTLYSPRPFHAILDTIGHQPLFTHSPNYLTATGILANVGNYETGFLLTLFHTLQNIFLPRALGGVPRRYKFFSTVPNRQGNVELVRWVEEGKLRVLVDGVWSLEDGMEAFNRVASKRARGKVILKME